MQTKLINYLWAARLITTSPQGITFKEINERWLRSSYSEGNPLPRRTFTDWLTCIQDIFDINIECDRHTNRYYVAKGSRRIDTVDLWLMNSINLTSQLSKSKSIRERIQLEEIPSGNDLLETIISAMKSHHTIQMSYAGFGYDKPYEKEICPYCLRVFKKRWYLLTSTLPAGKIRVFALDRMIELSITNNTFTLPHRFSPNKYFSHSFGIYTGDGKRPQVIRIKANKRERDYLRTLPLHSSQNEVVVDEDWSVFEYKMHPTYDLLQELLSRGSNIEVLRPQSLREEMASASLQMANLYQ